MHLVVQFSTRAGLFWSGKRGRRMDIASAKACALKIQQTFFFYGKKMAHFLRSFSFLFFFENIINHQKQNSSSINKGL